MAELNEMLPEFDGFAVRYDPSLNPFFKAILVENLRKLGTCDAGKTLLKLIADARPRSRADFLTGVNVRCEPKAIKYVQSGHATAGGFAASASDRHIAPNGCNHYIMGSSANAALDPTASGDGTGSVCKMMFTNAQFLNSKGEMVTHPYIVLAHELIHSYHCLYGIKKPKDEELWATGIGIYAGEPMSENVFRTQLKLPPRLEYY